MARSVPCPSCRSAVPLSPRPADFPFCSERCRLLDLGSWMDGSYSIPAEEDDADADKVPDLGDDSGGSESSSLV